MEADAKSTRGVINNADTKTTFGLSYNRFIMYFFKGIKRLSMFRRNIGARKL